MIRIKTNLLIRYFHQSSAFRRILLFASLCLVLFAASAFRMVSGPLVLTSTANGKTMTVSSGNQVIIQLPNNSGSTGYTWNFTTSKNRALTWQSATYLPPSGKPMPGAAGTIVFTFLAHNSGSVQLNFALQRSWEAEIPPVQHFTVTVHVQPNGQI